MRSPYSVLIFCTLLWGQVAPAQTSQQQRFQNFIKEYQKLEPGSLTFLGRTWAGSAIGYSTHSAKKKKGELRYQESIGFVRRSAIVDFFGIRLKVQYAKKIRDPSLPLVAFHPGFSGTLDSALGGDLLSEARETFPDANLVVFEGLSNKDFAYRNCFFSLGGLHEPYLIAKVLEEIQKGEKIQNPDVFLFGSSSSSFSVIATPLLLPMKGSFLTSGYNDLSSVYRWVLGEGHSEDTFVPDPLFKKGFRSMMKKRSVSAARKRLGKNSSCDSKLGDRDTFKDLLDWTFETHKRSLEKAWVVVSSGKPVPPWKNLGDYLESLALNRWIDAVTTPFFWLQAKNDPMPTQGQFQYFFSQAGGNPWIAGDLVESGGHAHFGAAYGAEWLRLRRRLFLNSL
ncbi:MAG: hypothetical protein JNL01_13300 [Bdellovibrionales bacterium]|nr:hypothetical protein [Bdellovibrionales bacterium]